MSETIYFPDGRVEVRFDGPIEPLELHTNLYECAECGHLHYEGMGWYQCPPGPDAPCPICNCKGQVSCCNCGQLAHRHRETDYSTMCPTGGTAWAVLCRCANR